MNVTIYCRISLDRSGEMLGVDRQRDECLAYCERMGWTVREILVDNDISATSGKVRPAFEKLLKSNPEAIVVWHTDRLVRMTKELQRIIDLKVNVYALHAGYFDLSTPAGVATAITVTAWAEYEGKQKSLRQKSSHMQRAAAGKAWWTKRPFGYEMDGTLRELEARAIETAYIDLVSGKATLSETARYWNAQGMLTTSKVPNQWDQSKVRQVLASPRNAAIRTQHGAEVGFGLWTPVVSEDLYRAACAVLGDPGRKTGGGGRRKGMLVGVARCGKCDSTMRLSTNGRSDTGYHRVYSCTANQCTSHPVEEVDEYVGEVMVATLRHPKVAELMPEDDSARDLLTERESLLVSMKNVGEDYADGLIGRVEFKSLRVRQQSRLAEVDAAIRASLSSTSLGDLPDLGYMAEHWFDDERMTMTHRRQAIEGLIDVVCLPRVKGARTYDPATSLRITDVNEVSPAR